MNNIQNQIRKVSMQYLSIYSCTSESYYTLYLDPIETLKPTSECSLFIRAYKPRDTCPSKAFYLNT